MLKNILALGVLAAAFIGCQTTNTKITEPERSEYYFFCIGNGVLVTTCACMEEKAVKDTGITSINEEAPDSPKVAQFLKALEDAIPACKEETDKLLEAKE